MTNEELVQLYQEGSKQALNELIRQNMDFVKWIANSYGTQRIQAIDFDDLVQEGCIGLMKAAEKYDFENENKAKFRTYAIYHIKAKISEYIKKSNTVDECSLNSPVYDDDNKTELVDSIKDSNDPFDFINERLDRNILRNDLEKLMKDALSLEERTILMFLYGWDGKCLKYDEVGKILQLSRYNIDLKERSSLKKLRNTDWIHNEGAIYYYGCKLEKLKNSSRNFNSFIVEDELKERFNQWMDSSVWGDIFE